MSKKSDKNSLTPLSESIRKFLTSLVGLAQLDKNCRRAGSSKEYSPNVELIMKIGETCKGWDPSSFRLFKKNGYFAEIWTDKKTSRQIIVAFSGDEKSSWPVAFEVLDENTALTGILSGVSRELLVECSEAALRSLKKPVTTNCALPFEGRKQVA